MNDRPVLSAFSDNAHQLATDVAVVTLYQTLLGRDPENSFVMAEAKSQSLAALVNSFIASDEFASYVREPIALGGRLRHELLADSPPPGQRNWIASLLLLVPEEREALVSATTWREFLQVFCRFVDGDQPPIVEASLTDLGRLPFSARGAISPRTFGRVEFTHRKGICGWAIGFPDLERQVELDCYIGEKLVSHAACTILRPDVAEVFGCSRATGFDAAFPENFPVEVQIGMELRLVDSSTGSLVCLPAAFNCADRDRSWTEARQRRTLALINWHLDEIKWLMDRGSAKEAHVARDRGPSRHIGG